MNKFVNSCMFVVYFDQCLGAIYYKRWLKYVFSLKFRNNLGLMCTPFSQMITCVDSYQISPKVGLMCMYVCMYVCILFRTLNFAVL